MTQERIETSPEKSPKPSPEMPPDQQALARGEAPAGSLSILMVLGNPVPAVGGAEIQAVRLAVALRDRGHRVSFVVPRLDPSQPGTGEVSGVPVRRCRVLRIPAPGGGSRLHSLTSGPAILLAALRSRPRPDVIHLHQMTRATLGAAAAARLRGIPVLCKLGNSGPRFDFAQVRHSYREGAMLLGLFRRWVGVFVAPGFAVAADLKRAGVPDAQVTVIPNGVDTREFDARLDPARLGPACSAPGSASTSVCAGVRREPGDPFVLAWCGTLTAKKNLALLLNALAEVAREGGSADASPVYLNLIGDGPERQSLEQLARTLGLADRVTFTGKVEDVRPHLAASDAFVLPSVTEGLSNALLEAMAAGLPSVASAVGGNPELLLGWAENASSPSPLSPPSSSSSSRSLSSAAEVPSLTLQPDEARRTPRGFLTDPGSKRALVEAIRALAADPAGAREMGRRARELVERCYEIRSTAERYEDLYNRLLSEGPGVTLTHTLAEQSARGRLKRPGQL